jgi:hypothetical protein
VVGRAAAIGRTASRSIRLSPRVAPNRELIETNLQEATEETEHSAILCYLRYLLLYNPGFPQEAAEIAETNLRFLL